MISTWHSPNHHCHASIRPKSRSSPFQAESDFFARHPKLQPLQTLCGIPNLAQRLQCLLLKHIREALPTLRSNMQTMAESWEKELEKALASLDIAMKGK